MSAIRQLAHHLWTGAELCSAVEVHVAEQRVKDCERQLQAVHAAAQTLADEKGDLHAQVAALEDAVADKTSLQDRILELEAQVSHGYLLPSIVHRRPCCPARRSKH